MTLLLRQLSRKTKAYIACSPGVLAPRFVLYCTVIEHMLFDDFWTFCSNGLSSRCECFQQHHCVFFVRVLDYSKQVANFLIDPMVRGIYAGNIKQLSVKSCFRALFDLEQSHGSIIKGAVKERLKKIGGKLSVVCACV